MTGKRRLGALFFDKFELLDIFGPLEMFGVLPDLYEIVTVAERKPSMASTQGPSVTIDRTFADCGQLDVLLVPGGIGTRGEVNNPALLRFISGSVSEADDPRVDLHRRGSARARGCARRPARDVEQARVPMGGRTGREDHLGAGSALGRRRQRVHVGRRRGRNRHGAGASSRRSNSDEVATGVAQHTEYDWHRDASWDPFAKLNNLV